MAATAAGRGSGNSVLTRFRTVLNKLGRGVLLHTHYHLLERDTAPPYSDGQPLVPVDWRKGVSADIDTFNEANFNYNALRRQYAHEALEEGGEFVVGVHAGEIVHVGWTSYRHIVFPGFTLKLAPSRAYFYDTRTLERLQGNRLQGAGIRKRLEAARARGAARAVNCVDATNGTSRRNYEREGFRVIGDMHTWRLFRKWHIARVPAWVQPYLLDQGDRPATPR